MEYPEGMGNMDLFVKQKEIIDRLNELLGEQGIMVGGGTILKVCKGCNETLTRSNSDPGSEFCRSCMEQKESVTHYHGIELAEPGWLRGDENISDALRDVTIMKANIAMVATHRFRKLWRQGAAREDGSAELRISESSKTWFEAAKYAITENHELCNLRIRLQPNGELPALEDEHPEPEASMPEPIGLHEQLEPDDPVEALDPGTAVIPESGRIPQHERESYARKPEALKPCPFCGGEAVESYGNDVFCQTYGCGVGRMTRDQWQRRAT